MGEIADSYIYGLVDYETGEMIDGDMPGYPRRSSERFVFNNEMSRAKCPNCKRKFAAADRLKQHRASKGH